ncbi:Glutamyl-tRNA(Gln) amidotransferase subunit A [Cladobotryum mycophilum]|uniref:Glutamyl-tRNA(Gln) amidotransferase subunit A, mitochondrial n=1 Tax=Cladobotryum mycophilum TaxID=491253 RepID=A0ABR0SG88_9HYPO
MRAAFARRGASTIRPWSENFKRFPVAAPQWQRSQSTYNHFVKSCKFYALMQSNLMVNHTSLAKSPFIHENQPFRDDAGEFTLAVKDNIATADFRTQCASGILLSHPSPFEATIVSQLRRRGAVVVGKTNMDEFGMGSHSTNSIHGPVRNPRSPLDEPYSAGGSSGGSAVAVLLGDAEFALGTDTGGSVRLPAAYTSVVGYKPSYGMLSRYGVVPYANSLDTVGLLARDAQDIRRLIFDTDLHLEHDKYDPTSLSFATRERCFSDRPLPEMSELTIGIPLEYNTAELDPSIRETWIDTASVLESQGARIVPVSLPSTKQALSAYYILAPAEASSNLAKYDGVRYGVRGPGGDAAGETLYSEARGAGFGEEVKRRILLGTYSLSSEAMDNYFIKAQKVRRLVQRDFDRVFKLSNPLYDPVQFDLSEMPEDTNLDDKRGPPQVDFLLTPTAPTFPPKLSEVKQQSSVDSYMNDILTVPASLAGIPAVSIPIVIHKNGRFSVGMQIMGQYSDDMKLLDFANKVQKLMDDFHDSNINS